MVSVFESGGSMLRYRDGEVVFAEGDVSDVVYVIVRGAVRIRKEGEPVATVVAELRPGELFGESALVAGRTRSATATAVGDTELASYERDAFLEALGADPESAVRAIILLAERLRVATGRLHQLATQYVLDQTDIALTEKAVLESELS